MRKPTWTPEEIEILREFYPTKGKDYVAGLVKHTPVAVQYKAMALKITHRNTWTKQQLDYMHENYGKISAVEIAKTLNRPVQSVRIKACKLNLQQEQNRWTAEEKKVIMEMYSKREYSIKDIAAKLGRSTHTVKAKAKEMKIRRQRGFSKEDESYLRENFGKISLAEMAKKLVRTKKTVLRHVTKMGLRTPRENKSLALWTPREIRILKKFYPERGSLFCSKYLKRTLSAVKTKVGDLKLHSNLHWSEWQVAYLKKHYGKKNAKQIAKATGRSVQSVREKASELGIKFRKLKTPAAEIIKENLQ